MINKKPALDDSNRSVGRDSSTAASHRTLRLITINNDILIVNESNASALHSAQPIMTAFFYTIPVNSMLDSRSNLEYYYELYQKKYMLVK